MACHFLTLHGTEGTGADVEGDFVANDATLPSCLKASFGEVKSGRWGSHTALDF